MLAQVGFPRRHLFVLAKLSLDRGERGLERVGRRFAITSLAALVEIHWRMSERERDGRRFRRRGRPAVIFLREIREAELVVARCFPQEIRIELSRELLRVGVESRRRGRGEP